MILLPSLPSICPACQSQVKRRLAPSIISSVRSYSAESSSSTQNEEYSEDFSDMAGELKRRKRKADSKRRQYGNTFVDHILVTVRGGKGGSGAAALQATLRGAGPSAPCGGNGGSGGSVYLTTSPSLSSLSTMKKRIIGGQGSNGSGAFKHGKRGEDVLITVPVGTIVKEIRREGEEERTIREEDDLGLSDEEKKKRKWQRWIITHPSAGGEVSTEEYTSAVDALKKENRWNISTPTFEELPPIQLDLEEHIREPILLSKGGLGGLGNPFFPSPRVASKGFLPPIQTFEFELKLLSDIGLVGFPNSGKSTLLRSLTGKKTEIANYQFTTLNPQIGVVRVFDHGENKKLSWSSDNQGEIKESWKEREDEELSNLLGEPLYPENSSSTTKSTAKGQVEKIRFTISDNPGLLPQASENVGLGHSFLRSIERSPILLLILDLNQPSPLTDLLVLKRELENYKEGLSMRSNLIILNKADSVEEEDGKKKLNELKEYLDNQSEEDGNSSEVITLSSKYNLGIDRLIEKLVEKVERARRDSKNEKEEKERKKLEKKKIGSFGLKKIENIET